MIHSLIRPHLLRFKPYTSARHLHLDGGLLLDANENPFGSVVKAPYRLPLNRYPDPFSRDLRKALSKYLDLPEEKIFLGVGSDEIVDLLLKLFIGPGDEVVIFEPTYGMFRVASEIAGAEVKSCLLTSEFQMDWSRFEETVSPKTKMAFCCSPNNPTGNLLKEASIAKLCKNFKGIVVVDEAYVDFASGPSLIKFLPQHRNLVLLRTFSKIWGLAGLRVGYALAGPIIVDYLNKIKLPYNLSTLSVHLARKALANKRKFQLWRKRILREREKLNQTLRKMGLEIFPSETNFLLVRVPNASRIVKTLAFESGIIVRDFSDKPLLKDCFRVTVGTPRENKKFLRALRGVL